MYKAGKGDFKRMFEGEKLVRAKTPARILGVFLSQSPWIKQLLDSDFT